MSFFSSPSFPVNPLSKRIHWNLSCRLSATAGCDSPPLTFIPNSDVELFAQFGYSASATHSKYMGKDDAAGKSKETRERPMLPRGWPAMPYVAVSIVRSVGGEHQAAYSWDRCYCAADDVRFNWLLPLFLARLLINCCPFLGQNNGNG